MVVALWQRRFSASEHFDLAVEASSRIPLIIAPNPRPQRERSY